MNAKKKQPAQRVYKIKFTLQGIRPPIWRRMLVPADYTLADLHGIIQIAMDWEDCHLHAFKIGRAQYGSCFEDNDLGFLDDAAYQLIEVLGSAKKKFSYTYDFGDSWTLDIAVEDVLPVDPDVTYPLCLTGRRHGPMEDSGGPWGYLEKLEILQDPDHPEYPDILDWVGDDWDPDQFSVDELNHALHRAVDEAGADFESLSEAEQDVLLESMLDEDPFLEERVARLHDRIASVHGLTTPEATHDFIESMTPEELRNFAMKHMAENPKDAAFEYGLLALEVDDIEEAAELAAKALELDPDNVDARIVRANIAMSEGDPDRAVAILREAVDVATRLLGRETLAQQLGNFADRAEFRPYLRARFILGHTLQELDKTEEAAEHYSKMLAQDPDDTMGVRFALAGVYLELGKLEETHALIQEYASEKDMVFPWAYVLERYLSGDIEEAEAALEGAISSNPLMATSLLDPDSADDLDTESDLGVAATMALASVGKAWSQHQDALTWLRNMVYNDTD